MTLCARPFTVLGRPLLAACAVSVLLAAGAIAPRARAAGAPEAAQGTMRLGHGDPVPGTGGPTTDAVWVESADGAATEVVGLSTAKAAQLQGRKVSVRGTRQGRRVRTSDTEVQDQGAAPATSTTQATTTTTSAGLAQSAGTVDTRTIAVLLVTFGSQAAPYTADAARNAWFGTSGSVDDYYRQASYGQRGLSGDVFGWYSLNDTNTGCRYSDWSTAARNAATAQGVNLSAYQHVAVVWPRTPDCGWAGMATVGGGSIWIDGYGTYVSVLAHELGHNFSFKHAASLTCKAADGTPTSLSGTCTSTEYGDPFDVMGNGSRLLSAYHRLQRGWTPDVTTMSAAGTYALAPLPGSAATRQLRYVRKDGTALSFELRRSAAGFDSFASSDPAVNGLIVRRTAGTTTVALHHLIDTNPATSTFADAPLAVGRTLVDPLDGARFTVQSLGAAGAVLAFAPTPDASAPTTPGSLTGTSPTSSSVRLSWTASTDDTGVATYRVSRGGTVVGSTTSTAYTDSGLAAGTSYGYSVVAFDAAGNASAAATTTVATTAADAQAPTSPAPLSVTIKRRGTVQLSWAASTDNVGVTAYQVYRDGKLVATTSPSTRTLTDKTTTGAHTWTVYATDAAGNRSAGASTTKAL